MTGIECVLLVYDYSSTQGGYLVKEYNTFSRCRLSLRVGRVLPVAVPRHHDPPVIPPRREGILWMGG